MTYQIERSTTAIETEISARIRATVAKLRTTPMPLADLIPLLQTAADEADKITLAVLVIGPLLFLAAGVYEAWK